MLRKFVEALDEDKKRASEALVYIGKLYGIEKEMLHTEIQNGKGPGLHLHASPTPKPLRP